MKPSELRIGNYCQTNKGYLLQVNALSENGIDFHLVDREKYPIKETWQAEFIPLTEEWLEKFGFDLDGHSGLYSKSGFDLEVVHNGVEFFLGEYGSAFLYVEHVHQLQNLYFALTGEELQITEQ